MIILIRYWDLLAIEKGWDGSIVFLLAALESLLEIFILVVIIMALRIFVIGA